MQIGLDDCKFNRTENVGSVLDLGYIKESIRHELIFKYHYFSDVASFSWAPDAEGPHEPISDAITPWYAKYKVKGVQQSGGL